MERQISGRGKVTFSSPSIASREIGISKPTEGLIPAMTDPTGPVIPSREDWDQLGILGGHFRRSDFSPSQRWELE